jgi:hypothetical protein
MSAPKLTIETPFVDAAAGETFCELLEHLPEVAFAHFSFDTGMTYILLQPNTDSATMHRVWLRAEELKGQQSASSFKDSSWWRDHVPQLPPDRLNN